MRALPIAVFLLGSLFGVARADAPTVAYVRNLGTAAARVQIALGHTTPCDSTDNQIVFDGTIAGGETRAIPMGDAVVACAHHTSANSTIDWQPSTWIRGGIRCRGGRGGPCWRDPSVPMLFDVHP